MGGGKIVLSVPSHMWLWNRDDRVAGHKIRYTKKDLIDKLEANGFKILEARYFFMTITPLLFLRRVLNKDNGSSVKDEEYSQDISMNKYMSDILLFLSRVENRLNDLLPNLFGGSLSIVGQRI